MKAIKITLIVALALFCICILIFFATAPKDQSQKTSLTNRPPPKRGLLTEAAIAFRLDSLSKAYKGKSVTLRQSSWFHLNSGVVYKFKFLRDTTTLLEVPFIRLKAGDKVKIVGEGTE